MLIAAIIILILFIGLFYRYRKKNKSVLKNFPDAFRRILEEKVSFYKVLNVPKKLSFENKMLDFLARVRITGIHTKVEEEDKVFVAAGAIIPVFAFEKWKYVNLNEVLLYPDAFSEEYELWERSARPFSGMVGNGPMQNVMILSQPALRQGFLNTTDTHNPAIHEFVHLIDKTDGEIDGIPEMLLSKQFLVPWIDMMQKKLQEINEGNSDINPYAATNRGEFFAVVSEYFFERPDLLQYNHPELYQLLEKIFDQDPAKNYAG